jgi:4'-phosphopantetheinyl transferase
MVMSGLGEGVSTGQATTIELWCLDFARAPALAACHLSDLSGEELERLQRQRTSIARRGFALSRIALRHVMATYLGIPAWRVPLAIGSRGKPHLCGVTGLRFNLSHSHACAAIAVSHRSEVGVDIEPWDSFDDSQEMWPLACSADERHWLSASPTPEDASRRFGRLWTRKEAILKAIGIGIGIDLRLLQLLAHSVAPGSVQSLAEAGLHIPAGLRFTDMHSIPGHAGAVCVAAGASSIIINLRHFDADRLAVRGPTSTGDPKEPSPCFSS